MAFIQQLLEFIPNHPYLIAALAAGVVLLVLNELWGRSRGAKRLVPIEAIRLINHEDAVVLDLRAAKDYKKGHIINARNIPANNVAGHLNELEKFRSRPILCYCAFGNAAPQACETLSQNGFENCYVLKGGVNAWQAAELPLTTR